MYWIIFLQVLEGLENIVNGITRPTLENFGKMRSLESSSRNSVSNNFLISKVSSTHFECSGKCHMTLEADKFDNTYLIELHPRSEMSFLLDTGNKRDYLRTQVTASPVLSLFKIGILESEVEQGFFIQSNCSVCENTISTFTLETYPDKIIYVNASNSLRTKVNIIFKADFSVSEWKFPAWTFVIIGLGAAFIIILLSLFYWRRKMRLRNNSRSNDIEANNSEDKIKKYELVTQTNFDVVFQERDYKSFQTSFPQTSNSCSICLEQFQLNSVCRQLDCTHIFHAECIKTWIFTKLTKGKAFCPNCMKEVLIHDKFEEK